ncbi:hypothetical protein DSO57_1024225 [Entomophthora muscae]|uniref:Uncharacterized protein n=1 Tax=Entomophthora muscae TaxID=34485 RepID=A0ACC2SRP5_9FUNG|nr:hypothetical protein DSO57_1024225 [Entomophthora muscae]
MTVRRPLANQPKPTIGYLPDNQAQKPPPKNKSPPHEEHHNKPPSYPPLSSPHFSLSGDVPKPWPNYFSGFFHASTGPWDPLVALKICNVDKKFKVSSSLPNFFPS